MPIEPNPFGVIDLLRQRDPSWRVASVKWLRTIETPKRFESTLGLVGKG